MKYSKIKFLIFFAIICSIGLAPINDASAAENTVIATVPVGTNPEGIAFDSANNRMYVANQDDDTVSVINTTTNAVDATISVGTNPDGIAFDSANNRMYVANAVANTVSVINTATNAVDATISVGTTPSGIAFDSANNRMYVPNYSDDTVSVINTATNAVDATISVGDGPRAIAFDSANNRMYVTNSLTTTVSVINTTTNAVDATISLTSSPQGIAFDSANNRMYVANIVGDTVSVIDTSDNTVTATITVGDGPLGVAFDSANNRMYVTNYSAGTVSVIDIAPTSSSSDCYDCIPPKLQQIQINTPTDNYVLTGDDQLHITANVGDTISVNLQITDNISVQSIPAAALYTNYQEKPSDMSLHYANNFDNLKQTSTSFYEWNVRSDDVAYDYDGTVSWDDNTPTVVTGEITEDNFKFKNKDQNALEYFMMPFTFTINEHMQTSQVTAKIYDAAGNRLHVTLPVTLETAGNDPLNFDNMGKQKVLGFFNESVLDVMILELNGSEDTAPLSEFLGIPDESLPAWTLDLATWVADEKIDSADLIVAVEYLINQ